MMPVNYWAVLASAFASMMVGSIWYGPLFGKLFMKASGMDTWSKEKKDAAMKNMGLSYVGQFIASLVMFYMLAGIIVSFGHASFGGGIMTALLIWLGFIVPVKIGDLAWGGDQRLFWLNTGYYFVNMIVVGAILGAWTV
jgi:hypothetical protein